MELKGFDAEGRGDSRPYGENGKFVGVFDEYWVDFAI